MGQKPLRDSLLGWLLQNLQNLGLTEILSLNWFSTVTQSDTNINWTMITIDKNRTFSISKFCMISKTPSNAMGHGLRCPYIWPLSISPPALPLSVLFTSSCSPPKQKSPWGSCLPLKNPLVLWLYPTLCHPFLFP
jgi:hypothetical protein